jgi:integrase
MLVSDITMRDVRNVLEQDTVIDEKTNGKLWYVKTETAKRLLGRIKTVLDYATVNEYRSGNNPAQWTGFLDTQLPSPQKISETRHQPALPYNQAASFMSKLRLNKSISSKALQFLILTGVRSGSVRLAEWSEIDFTKKLWIIPAAHTKARKEHRVPLQPQAITLLKSLHKLVGTQVIFPSVKGGSLSDMALSQLMRGMHKRGDFSGEAVPHGFRSTFRDWAAEQTNYPDELRKIASMHTVSDAVKAAYERTDLLDKRRDLMNEWADFLDKTGSHKNKK